MGERAVRGVLCVSVGQNPWGEIKKGFHFLPYLKQEGRHVTDTQHPATERKGAETGQVLLRVTMQSPFVIDCWVEKVT